MFDFLERGIRDLDEWILGATSSFGTERPARRHAPTHEQASAHLKHAIQTHKRDRRHRQERDATHLAAVISHAANNDPATLEALAQAMPQAGNIMDALQVIAPQLAGVVQNGAAQTGLYISPATGIRPPAPPLGWWRPPPPSGFWRRQPPPPPWAQQQAWQQQQAQAQAQQQWQPPPPPPSQPPPPPPPSYPGSTASPGGGGAPSSGTMAAAAPADGTDPNASPNTSPNPDPNAAAQASTPDGTATPAATGDAMGYETLLGDEFHDIPWGIRG